MVWPFRKTTDPAIADQLDASVADLENYNHSLQEMTELLASKLEEFRGSGRR